MQSGRVLAPGDGRELVGPIETAARADLRLAAVHAQLHAVAVELDLVRPAGSRGRTIHQLGELRFDEVRQGGQTLCSDGGRLGGHRLFLAAIRMPDGAGAFGPGQHERLRCLADSARNLVHRATRCHRAVLRDQRRGAARLRILVLVFDQQPVGASVAPAVVPDLHEHPTTFEPFAGENELEIAGLESVFRTLRSLRRPVTAVPHLHGAAAVLTLRDRAFEIPVVERMIFHLHGQALVGGIDRRALGDGPRFEDAVQFKSQVIVET